MSPVDITYGNVPGIIIFWVLIAVALGLFLHKASKLWRYLLLGKGWQKVDRMPRRALTAFIHVVEQWCQFKTLTRKDFAGLGHVLMAWGFFIFVVYYFLFIIIGAGFSISESLENSATFFYYSWVMDIAAPLVMLAALWGIVRRYIIKPPRLKGEQTFEALVILVTVLIHPLTHLFKEATSIALGYPPVGLGASLPPISSALSQLFNGHPLSSIQGANIGFFWSHWAIVLFVLVFIAYSRYLHMIAAPFNILLRPSRPQDAVQTIDFTAAEAFGISSVRDFTRKQLLESCSCVVCGRCQDVCPAYVTDKPLSPKKIVQDIKRNLLQAGPGLINNRSETGVSNLPALAGGVITEDELWACTTCNACAESCPVANNQVGMILELRRKLVYEGIFDKGQKRALQRVGQDFNPWGLRWNTRAKNSGLEEAKKGERYDCIYWLGCVASFDDRVRDVAQATAKILKAAGLKFAILGAGEKCCGDFVRRIGDEGLFQKLAADNIQTLKGFNFDFILTHCPHCFNTLKNEYPEFGGDFKMIHHTQLISNFLKADKIKLQESSQGIKVTAIYHDPCYLGRWNNIYSEPRQILKQVFGEFTEFPNNHSRSFCCGAGGGSIWKEQEIGLRMSVERLEEGLNSRPQVLATACPLCFLMFQEAVQIKGMGNEIKLLDIAEIVEKYLR